MDVFKNNTAIPYAIIITITMFPLQVIFFFKCDLPISGGEGPTDAWGEFKMNSITVNLLKPKMEHEKCRNVCSLTPKPFVVLLCSVPRELTDDFASMQDSYE